VRDDEQQRIFMFRFVASGVLMGDRIFWIDGVPFWK